MRRDLFNRLIDVGQVGVAVAAPHRRANGKKDQIGGMRDRGKFRCEMQPARAHVLLDERVQPRLVNRDLACVQLFDLARVLFDAGDVPAEFGETGGGNKADISGPNHANIHGKRPRFRNEAAVLTNQLGRGKVPDLESLLPFGRV